ncbi:hypothetical protein LSTR_LSTR014630 [Laodelphax striatellus]|uniref:Uncharacterized protein n=1 Tax=Laodelphax striatellus TaxID=195883 RepID=A0A482XQH7_LAOST|nr:hypothetical protein LSTR_LSTR014630 [Laodelphax striatellus]
MKGVGRSGRACWESQHIDITAVPNSYAKSRVCHIRTDFGPQLDSISSSQTSAAAADAFFLQVSTHAVAGCIRRSLQNLSESHGLRLVDERLLPCPLLTRLSTRGRETHHFPIF